MPRGPTGEEVKRAGMVVMHRHQTIRQKDKGHRTDFGQLFGPRGQYLRGQEMRAAVLIQPRRMLDLLHVFAGRDVDLQRRLNRLLLLGNRRLHVDPDGPSQIGPLDPDQPAILCPICRDHPLHRSVALRESLAACREKQKAPRRRRGHSDRALAQSCLPATRRGRRPDAPKPADREYAGEWCRPRQSGPPAPPKP